MRNPQIYESGKRPLAMKLQKKREEDPDNTTNCGIWIVVLVNAGGEILQIIY